jgi:penicillin-binding protein 1A
VAKKTKAPIKRKYVLYFWLLAIAGPCLIALHLYCISIGLWGPLPTFDELENPKSFQATEVYSADQKVLGTYFVQNRSNINYQKLSPHLVNALVSTEDERYYWHSGVDLYGLARAIILMGKKGGGSTVTQQLAKNLFETRGNLKGGALVQKPAEWIIATRLERRYTKEEIIALYLNTVDFVNGAVGIKSASKVYFNTSPDSLKIEQAAMFVGMLKNPALFNPRRRLDTTLHRRNVVFGQMVRNQVMTEEEKDSLSALPIELDYRTTDHNQGLATYFREHLRNELKTWCSNHTKPDGTNYDLYRDGLRVYTTIDSRLQTHAEEAVSEHLIEHQGKLWKDQKRNDDAPFRDVTDKEIESIMLSSMRRSTRYNERLDERQDIRKRYRGYYEYKRQRNGYESEIGDLYKQYERAERMEREDELEPIQKRIDKLRRKNKKLQPDLDRTWDYYQEIWKPFDDSLRVEFQQPVEMSIFSWAGDIDTVLTPMDSIRYYKHFLQTGVMSMDPRTGFVRAWVGGINYKHFKYDNVKQGSRQVGSTFKPFVYALAIQEGWSPCEKVLNIPVTFEKDRWGLPENWTPKNSDDKFEGEEISLKKALANSVNTVTAFVMKKFGPQAVVDLVKKMGITAPIDPYPAICLGTPSLSVYEMTAAHCTFTNKGVYTEPVVITRVEDKAGNVLEEFVPKTHEVMNEHTAYAMMNLMEGVVRYGSGIRLKYKYKLEPPMAGKTGTTQNQSDGWFIGHTPDLVTGVWVGCEDRASHFRTIREGQGASMALPIWALYMKKVYADKSISISTGAFERPEGELTVELDCDKYDKLSVGKQDRFSDTEIEF